MIDWTEYTTESYPAKSGLYMRANEVGYVESLWYMAEKNSLGNWENDEGTMITGTTHWAELPAGPGK